MGRRREAGEGGAEASRSAERLLLSRRQLLGLGALGLSAAARPALARPAAARPALGRPAAAPASARITIGTVLEMVSVDPFLGGWALPAGSVFQSLVALPAGGGELLPVLATRWSRAADGSLSLSLAPGATFSDGTPVRPSDAAFSIHLAATSASPLGQLLGPVSARASGNDSLLVFSERPDAVLERRIAAVPVVSQASYDTAATQPGTPPQLLGSGPFVLAGFSADRSMLLQASPNTWSGAAALSSVTIREMGSASALLDALDSGALDVAQDLPASALSVLAGRFSLQVLPSGVVSYLVLRTGAGPFADLDARRAVALALDAASLASGVLGGTATPLAGQLAIPGTVGYSPALQALGPDVGAARRALALAGHPSGLDTELAGPSVAAPLLDAIAAQLRVAGIRARVTELDTAGWLAELDGGGSGRWPLLLAQGDLAPLFDVGPLYQSLADRAALAVQPLAGGASFARLAEQQAGELLPARRALLLSRLAGELRQQLPVVPLCAHGWVYGMRPGVGGLSVLGPTIELSALRLRS